MPCYLPSNGRIFFHVQLGACDGDLVAVVEASVVDDDDFGGARVVCSAFE